jgi:bis(5'-nucleosyl)-tetraphosphatase (symmetrical)
VGGRGLLGNHEVHALLARSGRVPKRIPALDDLFDAPDGDDLLALLRDLPILVHLASVGDGPDAWIVHAGLHPRWTDLAAVADRVNGHPHDDDWLTSDGVRFATSVRCCDATGRTCKFAGPPEDCPSGFRPWDSFYRGDTLVVHGHWARRGHHRTGNVLGLDSGCLYGGSLTAWCQDEDRVVQIPRVSR